MDTCPSINNLNYDELICNIRTAYCDESHPYPWIIGYSGGKDSTLVTHLTLDAILEVPPKKRVRNVYIVWNDTQVESPLVVDHVQEQLKKIENVCKCFSIPAKTIITRPRQEETFWILLIGKGYPTPNSMMRWCTDRLKIKPTSEFIKNNISQYGAAIVVLGVRKGESQRRNQTITKYRNINNSYLNEHNTLKGAYVYRPIEDLSTENVWYLLSHQDPPWGGTHEKLIQLYKDAEGGECPMMLSKDEAPACGSRFGCWVCTVVKKDKSLQGFVKSGKTKYQLLIDFRDWLLTIRDDPKYRQLRRRNGKIQYDNEKLVPGPFTLEARKKILEKLIKIQNIYGEQLISNQEIIIIKKQWVDDIVYQHEKN